MSAQFLGLALTTTILALLPSKHEAKWNAPYASMGLAIVAGFFAGCGFYFWH